MIHTFTRTINGTPVEIKACANLKERNESIQDQIANARGLWLYIVSDLHYEVREGQQEDMKINFSTRNVSIPMINRYLKPDFFKSQRQNTCNLI